MNRPVSNDDAVRGRIDEAHGRWEQQELAGFVARMPERKDEFVSASGIPLQRVSLPSHLPESEWEDLGLPGAYPFTRGPYPTMYRGRYWTMRQIAGFGSGKDTNARFHYLLRNGQSGLSVDFDMPTLMGYDSDHPMSLGEVGREGVAIDVLPDMEDLFEGIDLEQISVSLTINPSAWILLAMYIAVAEKQGADLTRLSGTLQNDILKEYIAQKEWIYPIEPSLRIVRDTIAYCSEHLPRYNPINISGYHISEAGGNAVQEAAFTLATTRTYVAMMKDFGLDVDVFAPRLSFFFVAQADLFEEVAKFRALRRVYARIMREEFGAKQPESMRMRFHAQTAAATLTRPQPMNNIIRTNLQALAAVLGGAQSLHTNGMDEAYTIPSEFAMKMALRTQQIIAEEAHVADVVDPLGGSYHVEVLTNEIEVRILKYLEEIDALGGTVAAIEMGWFQREISDTAYDIARRTASGVRPLVGVNRYVEDDDTQQAIEVHVTNPESESLQIRSLQKVRAQRDNARVKQLLTELKEVARDPSQNLMPTTIALVKEHASMGEIVEALREVFGSYQEVPTF